ncbi:MAG: hypothetical protein ABIJ86_16025, partial [Spirochaetota bacterium]
YVLKSDWYAERLSRYATSERNHLESGKAYLKAFIESPRGRDPKEMGKAKRELDLLEKRLVEVKADTYKASLIGTIGLDPLHRK